ncbi:MAG: hypothetical protein GY754_01460 [bacterium]|nr:hypothetical protein [bacterium]
MKKITPVLFIILFSLTACKNNAKFIEDSTMCGKFYDEGLTLCKDNNITLPDFGLDKSRLVFTANKELIGSSAPNILLCNAVINVALADGKVIDSYILDIYKSKAGADARIKSEMKNRPARGVLRNGNAVLFYPRANKEKNIKAIPVLLDLAKKYLKMK